MRVSYIKEGALDPTGSYNQHCDKVLSGTKMEVKELSEILQYCSSLSYINQDGSIRGKHQDGVVFPIVKELSGGCSQEFYQELNCDGVAFCDFDHLTTKQADIIYQCFEEIHLLFPPLYAMQFSSSYFIRRGSEDVGIHLFFSIPEGNGHDYCYYSRLCLYSVALAIEKATGINILAWYEEVRNNTLVRDKNGRETFDKVLDEHNCKPGQRFFLYHSPYKISEEIQFPRSYWNELKKNLLISKYQRFLQSISVEDTKEGESVFKNQDESGKASKQIAITNTSVTHKTTLDYGRDYPIANALSYLGYDEKFIVDMLCSIDDRDDNQYIKKHGHSIRTHFTNIARTAKGRTVTQNELNRVLNFLKSLGFEFSGTDNQGRFVMSQGEFLGEDKYLNLILSFIQDRRVSQIVAPTGTGKTQLILSRLVDVYRKCIIAVPFIKMKNLYNQEEIVASIFDKYKRKIKVCENSEDAIGYKGTCPICITYDRLDVLSKSDFLTKDDVLIIDESHILFLARSYRYRLVTLMNYLKRVGCKIILVSATPTDELIELGGSEEDKIVFYKKKLSIPTTITSCETKSIALENCAHLIRGINKGSYPCDHVVIFTNQFNRQLESLLKVEYGDDYVSLRNNTTTPEIAEVITKEEQLSKKAFIATALGENGFNILNQYERFITIIIDDEKEVYSTRVIQSVGRVRNSQNRLFIFTYEKDDAPIEEQEKTNKTALQFVSDDASEKDLGYKEDCEKEGWWQAKKEVEHFQLTHSGSELPPLLKQQGYFNVSCKEILKDKDKKVSVIVNKVKREQSNKFKETLKEFNMKEEKKWGTMLKNLKDSEGIYNELFYNQYLEIVNELKTEGVVDAHEKVYQFIQTRKEGTLIDSCLDVIEDLIEVKTKNDKQFEAYCSAHKEFIARLRQLNLNHSADRQKNILHYRIKLRKKYEDFNLIDSFDSVIDYFEEAAGIRKQSRSKGGKKGGKKGQAYKEVKTGIVFETRKSISDYYDKSEKWVAIHIENGDFLKI